MSDRSILTTANGLAAILKGECIIYYSDKSDQSLLDYFKIHAGITVHIGEGECMAMDSRAGVLLVDLTDVSSDIQGKIRELKEKNPDLTAIGLYDDSVSKETIIQFSRAGLADFFSKSENRDQLLEMIVRLSAENRSSKFSGDMNELHTARLRERLEWLTYKDSARNMGSDSDGKRLIENLRSSLTQGGGFGIILSLLEMARDFSHTDGGSCIVDKKIMDMIFSNAESARRFLDGLDSIIELMSSEFPKDRYTIREIVNALPGMAAEVRPFLEKRGIKLNFPSSESVKDGHLSIHMGFFSMVFQELLINAAKYMPADSPIDIYVTISRGYLSISVKNSLKDYKEKLPDNFTDQLVKPFFRFHPPYEDVVKEERFGMGLGLAAVNYILNKHNGIFLLSNVRDYTGDSMQPCVMAQMYLPVEP